VTSHSGHTVTADALRNWDGTIQLSTKVAGDAKRWSAAGGKSFEELHDEANKLFDDAARKQRAWENATPKQRAKMDPDDRGHRETKEANALLETASSSAAPKILVHEALHGYSPITMNAYRGTAGQIEELTTETLARVVSHDLFGITPLAHTQGAYAGEISAATNAIAEITGKTPEQSYEILQRSSERFKRNADKITASDDASYVFARDVGTEAGISPGDFRDALMQHLAAIPR
jgi:hypothetical protein